MSSSDLDLLESASSKTAALIAGVRPDQARLPTPCAEFDVEQVVAHVVGWAAKFAARLTDEPFDVDPGAYDPGVAPATSFRESTATIVGAYRVGGDAATKLPQRLLLMEFITHGWDLAVATGQRVPFTPDEAEPALAMAQGMLKPEYRGPGKTFGYETAAPDSADATERLVAFSGRDPGWSSTQP